MTEMLKYAPEKGLGNIDRILLRGAAAHKSWNEISKLTNGVVKPADAALRVEEILDERDPLSEARKKLLLIDDMMQVKDHLMAKALDFNNMDAVKPLISILTQLDKTMAAEKFDMSKAMNEISRAHAFLLLQATDLAFERLCLDIEKAHPEISRNELMELKNKALPEAIKAIESRVPANG